MAASAAGPRVLDAELVSDTRYMLGEGSLWHEPSGKLLHINIEGNLVGLLDPATGKVESWSVPSRVGTVVPVDGDPSSVVVCLEDGAHRLSLRDGSLTRISSDPEPDQPRNRFNDGKCDPAGRLWAGTMRTDPPRTPDGTLYRFDMPAEGLASPVPVVERVAISNGIAWTADNRTMLYIDTPSHQVDAFDFDLATGAVSGRRAAYRFPSDEPGHPDGCTLDADGNLWVALFGGSQVQCIDLEAGSVLARVRIPGGVTNITSVAFGGQGLRDLYITTAREGLSEEDIKEQPTAGGIFRVRDAGVRGLPPVAVKLA